MEWKRREIHFKAGRCISIPCIEDNSLNNHGHVSLVTSDSVITYRYKMKLALSTPRSEHMAKSSYRNFMRLSLTQSTALLTSIGQNSPNLYLPIHWEPEESFIKQLKAAEFKLLTICRHPLDTLISILHFCRFEPQTASWLDVRRRRIWYYWQDPDIKRLSKLRSQRTLTKTTIDQFTMEATRECTAIQYEKLVKTRLKNSQAHDILGHFHCPIEPTIKKYTLTEQKSTPQQSLLDGHTGLWSSW